MGLSGPLHCAVITDRVKEAASIHQAEVASAKQQRLRALEPSAGAPVLAPLRVNGRALEVSQPLCSSLSLPMKEATLPTCRRLLEGRNALDPPHSIWECKRAQASGNTCGTAAAATPHITRHTHTHTHTPPPPHIICMGVCNLENEEIVTHL